MKNFFSRGSITLLVLVFAGIFVTVILSLTTFVLTVNRAQSVTQERGEAFDLAEAGIQYYRWLLQHYPGDITNHTGHGGPYVTTYADPEGGSTGTYTLSVTGNSSCGIVQSIDVTSIGSPSDAPGVIATISARYAEPSVAAYSYIIGSSVWAGADRVINGPYHSNGGIRMDGVSNAPVTSSLSTWDCDANFGCTPEQKLAPGVVGSGAKPQFWSYPTPQVDFAAISSNFGTLKTAAQTNGLYLPRYSTSKNPHNGYHLIFNANGTVTVRRVSKITTLAVIPVNSTNSSSDYTLINTETAYQTLSLPAQCGLIFVEDNAWIEGTIPQKVTLVVANATTPGVLPDVVLHNNITYAATDGSDGLTVIGAHDILIAPDSPQVMTLNGVFVAQSGAFGRNYYGCPSAYEPRTSLTILGTTVSNLRTGTAWEWGCGATNAGYLSRIDSYDRQNMKNPPPFTPNTSTQWQIVDWEQK
ncbi:hypothetical protein KGM48_00480 [Patescibacteria group bacterium]|nr:hypothetical protein [Patescibacteria group bacterium]